jgi:hypothetical protein
MLVHRSSRFECTHFVGLKGYGSAMVRDCRILVCISLLEELEVDGSI